VVLLRGADAGTEGRGLTWVNPRPPAARDWRRFDRIDVRAAAGRLAGVTRRTPLVPIASGDPRLDLRGKMENEQVTGAFKARGAWNQISQLSDAQRRGGVVCPSSGNHGKALAWAAERAGVPAAIVMPEDAYPNKIEACRAHGARVVLTSGRAAADEECRLRVAAGATLVHPYEAERTIEGAGTVGLEIGEDWPDVEVVIVPVGGGGLIAGTSLALRRALGDRVRVVGAEPRGAPSMCLGLHAGAPVTLPAITTKVQGLCPPHSGGVNIEVCRETVDAVLLLDDGDILAAQARLVAAGHVVEPAAAAAAAVVFSGQVPAAWLAGRTATDPLRVCAVVSGGNPDPAQLAAVRGR
jgi:threonine dehydratase